MKKIEPSVKSVTFTTLHILFSYGVAFISSSSTTDWLHNPGFINIDCGSSKPELGFQSDEAFIDTGINKELPFYPPYANLSYLSTLRSFPEGDRNCYTLKALNGTNNSYLIRVEFYYGNYDGLNRPPIFDVYIDVSFWKTVGSPSYSFNEIVHKPRGDFINICLVNKGLGTPFISGLFLRPLNNSLYTSHLGSLDVYSRINLGVLNAYYPSYFREYLRHSDDIYDRFWYNPGTGPWQAFNTTTNFKHLSNDVYEVPWSILKGGIRPHAGNRSLNFPPPYQSQGQLIYVYWHFAETQKLGANESREFYIFSSDFHSGPITLKFMEPLTIVSSPITIGVDGAFLFSINQSNASSLPPILNALEIYFVTSISESATDQDDVNAIMDVKAKYNLSGWNGDPCLPISPWNGLKCSNQSDASSRITTLNLASRNLSGEILVSLSFLTSLSYLNLSYNMLTGMIPEFFSEIPSLKVIDISENRLSGSVPGALMDKVKSGKLLLSFDGNPDLITSVAPVKKGNNHKVVAYLVVSAFMFLLLLCTFVLCMCKWKKITGFLNAYTQRMFQGGDDGMEHKTRRFTYPEILNMTSNLQTIIGKGGSGTVYHGFLKDHTEVAVKILNASSSFSIQSFQTEAELLMRVHHRSLVSLVGYCDEGTSKALIYEYMVNGNLQDCLSGEHTHSLSWKERLQISIDAAEGLEYLHGGCKPAIVHRDLKTANILLDHRFNAKLADFGMSRIFLTESASHISTDHLAGTRGYLAPEYYDSYKLTEKGDIYSFGIVLFEVITGRGVMTRDETGKSFHIVEWVTPLLKRGDIENVVDPRLDGNFTNASAWKALEIAMACVSSISMQRPCMSQVLFELKECLAAKLPHTKLTSSNPASGAIHVDSEFSSPSAR